MIFSDCAFTQIFLCNKNVANSCRTVLVNDNISYLYMIYQAVVMGASLLAPATVSFIQMILNNLPALLRRNNSLFQSKCTILTVRLF